MLQAVILDTGVLSLLADRPGKSVEVIDAQNWLVGLLTQGVKVYVPEICDYELRRELIRANKTSGLQRLNVLVAGMNYLPLTTTVMRDAARLWATARNTGKPAADNTALGGDMTLCAQTLAFKLAEPDYIVATTNTKHLTAFVTTTEWRKIIF